MEKHGKSFSFAIKISVLRGEVDQRFYQLLKWCKLPNVVGRDTQTLNGTIVYLPTWKPIKNQQANVGKYTIVPLSVWDGKKNLIFNDMFKDLKKRFGTSQRMIIKRYQTVWKKKGGLRQNEAHRTWDVHRLCWGKSSSSFHLKTRVPGLHFPVFWDEYMSVFLGGEVCPLKRVALKGTLPDTRPPVNAAFTSEAMHPFYCLVPGHCLRHVNRRWSSHPGGWVVSSWGIVV